MTTTSGSTGEPLFIFGSKEAVEAEIETECAVLDYFGVTENDVVLSLIGLGSRRAPVFHAACGRRGVPVLPLGAWNTTSVERTLSVIERVRPTVWFGITSYVMKILDRIGPECVPRCIPAGGEQLLNYHIRKCRDREIEVYNQMGAAECGTFAVSRNKNLNRMEVIAKGVYVETVEIEAGDALVVTDLNNFAMPIVRYVTGDIVKDVRHNDDGSVKEFTVDRREDDALVLNGWRASKFDIVSKLSDYAQDFIVYIKAVGGVDTVEIVLPENCRAKEKEIIEALKEVHAEKYIVLRDGIIVPKTTTGKHKYVVDLRGLARRAAP
ncbi:AMP-binding enzyme [uncultured archaeon]|nr:AMP-binding enzyme [uncultured archaeon]